LAVRYYLPPVTVVIEFRKCERMPPSRVASPERPEIRQVVCGRGGENTIRRMIDMISVKNKLEILDRSVVVL
jgi:hypothetical protein